MTGNKKITSSPPGAWYKRLYIYLLYDWVYFAIVLVVGLFKEISTRAPVLQVESLPKRTGNVAVITGGPRVIAAGLVKRLVQLDFTIVMGARNIKQSQTRLDEIARLNPKLSFRKVIILPMDLMSLASVKEFAEEVLHKYTRIDLLLCNAAIFNVPYQLTEDGYDSQFQVNYLSHFLLTQLLLDRMKTTARKKGSACQIINTSSAMYAFGKMDFNELERLSTVYTPVKAYFLSRLYQVMSMLMLENKLLEEDTQVHCYAVHPGVIPTDMLFDSIPYLVGCGVKLIKRFMRSVENGADTILWPAFCPDYQDRGRLYMESGLPITITKNAWDKEAQARLFAKSEELLSEFYGVSCNNTISPPPPGIWYERYFAYALYDFIYTIMTSALAIWKEILVRPPVLQIDKLPKRTENVAVITGGPRGIAAGLVKRLVQLDFTIVMGARNVKESQRRLDEIVRSNPHLSFSKVTILPMNLMSLSSVKKFAEEVLNKYTRVDLLLCNAAVLTSTYQVTEDGYESTFQVNYLSHFLLTQLLRDRIKATAKVKGSTCQIIYASSLTYIVAKVEFTALETSTVYTPVKSYSHSKHNQVVSMLMLEKKLLEDGAQVHCYVLSI